jgi:FkbM family methyltransferase
MIESRFKKSASARMREVVKRGLQKTNDLFLVRSGLRIVNSRRPTRNFAEFFRHVKRLGFNPATVIDVGVAWGTDDLYEAFPRAAFCLIEPVAEFEPEIKTLARKYSVEYVISAAGSEAGELTLNLHADPRQSTILARNAVEQRKVSVVTLDSLWMDKPGPILLKVDTEGQELRVLEGAVGILQKASLVILEARLISYADGLPEFAEVVAFMASRGFHLYDLLDGGYRPLDGALEIMDLVFVPEGSAFRRNKVYSANAGDW